MLEHPIQLRIDDVGALDVSIGGKPVASGKWTAGDGGNDYTNQSKPGAAISGPVVKVISPTGPGIIQENFRDAAALHTFDIAGDDLRITTIIQNTGKQPIAIPRLSGLTIHFAKNAVGDLKSWHVSYTRQVGATLMHPSGGMTMLGAAYADDGVIGVGMHTPSHLDRQKLIQCGYTADYTIPKECTIQIDFNDSIRPGESKTFSINFHFAGATDWTTGKLPAWQVLLASYKRDFQSQLGGLAYHPDDRPVAQFSSADKAWVRPDNPWGFNGPARRFDTPKGTREFVEMVLPGLKRANGLGCLFWALGGYNPRGCMYRPDFDVFPPEIARNIPALVASFKSQGLRVGLAARPGEYVDRQDWVSDQTTQLSADSPDQMANLWKRFANMIALGFDMFYLDSFTLDYNHFRILQFLRKQAGPDILFWIEEGTDICSPFAGRYCELGENGKLSWTTPDLIQICRWLTPGTSYLCVPRGKDATIKKIVDGRMTPLMQDFAMADTTPGGAPIQLFRTMSDQLNGKTWK
ncbi:MAG: hypothetical protein M3O30_07935 [Planctomycetota bacterium]|nr:hypothetical protein [Planctomycetota bacterium]